ncbi:MAG: MerR family transcriptional regulator, partial [Solibacillus sp.]
RIEVDDSVMIIPKGKYVTIAYSKDDEKESISKIIKYIKAKNINVKSCIEVELFNDFFDTENYNCQLQMLIEEN